MMIHHCCYSVLVSVTNGDSPCVKMSLAVGPNNNPQSNHHCPHCQLSILSYLSLFIQVAPTNDDIDHHLVRNIQKQNVMNKMSRSPPLMMTIPPTPPISPSCQRYSNKSNKSIKKINKQNVQVATTILSKIFK